MATGCSSTCSLPERADGSSASSSTPNAANSGSAPSTWSRSPRPARLPAPTASSPARAETRSPSGAAPAACPPSPKRPGWSSVGSGRLARPSSAHGVALQPGAVCVPAHRRRGGLRGQQRRRAGDPVPDLAHEDGDGQKMRGRIGAVLGSVTLLRFVPARRRHVGFVTLRGRARLVRLPVVAWGGRARAGAVRVAVRHLLRDGRHRAVGAAGRGDGCDGPRRTC